MNTGIIFEQVDIYTWMAKKDGRFFALISERTHKGWTVYDYTASLECGGLTSVLSADTLEEAQTIIMQY